MNKIIIGAAIAACVNAFANSEIISDEKYNSMVNSEGLKEAIEVAQNQYMQSISGKYFRDHELILNIVDKKYKCKSVMEAKYITQNGINSNRGNYMRINRDDKQDYIQNFSLNNVYVPFCADIINKSVGSFSFSKKNITGVGINFSNANYCGNFYKYINHLSSQSNDLKYSFVVLISRFSNFNLNNYSGESDISIQAKALLHYLDYGKTGFDPVGFAEIYMKNNQSTKPKIGGKDEEFETFMLAIFAGSFKTADSILESNIQNSKKVFEFIENSEKCNLK